MVFTRDSTESLVCDILQLNVLNKGHLMFSATFTRIEIVKLCYSLGESATAALRGYKTKRVQLFIEEKGGFFNIFVILTKIIAPEGDFYSPSTNLNVLHKGHLIFQLVRHSRNRTRGQLTTGFAFLGFPE
ncbi:hypothetical protein T265_01055 [Opisthorchis viverrini]|uniref:Uncharacterized protein n=1 Tax=Opisthorchis viverrini TaxID=6198 RepID=A0A074ZZS2_OPIVI|nr:hypothetical protein T265_01055 [Opisthorchis viverrini]KER32963.1 hypothetical protein T265_01055 [Opisthorchis viverrini]